jgi:hypothetical protein
MSIIFFKDQNWAPKPHILLRHNMKDSIITSLTSYKHDQNVTISQLPSSNRTNLIASYRLPRAMRIPTKIATKTHDSVTPMRLCYLSDRTNHIQRSGVTRVRISEVSVAIKVAAGSERRQRMLLQITRRTTNPKYSLIEGP